jgi:hypothetical protein
MENKSHVPNHQPVYIYVGALGKKGISSASIFRYHEMIRLDWWWYDWPTKSTWCHWKGWTSKPCAKHRRDPGRACIDQGFWIEVELLEGVFGHPTHSWHVPQRLVPHKGKILCKDLFIAHQLLLPMLNFLGIVCPVLCLPWLQHWTIPGLQRHHWYHCTCSCWYQHASASQLRFTSEDSVLPLKIWVLPSNIGNVILVDGLVKVKLTLKDGVSANVPSSYFRHDEPPASEHIESHWNSLSQVRMEITNLWNHQPLFELMWAI